MGIKQDLEAEDAIIHSKLAIINAMPEDIYTFSTVAMFSFAGGHKDLYTKVAEELWADFSGTQRPLYEWIYLEKYAVAPIYFEVYILSPAASPIYASA